MKRVIFFSVIGIIVAFVIFFGFGLNKSLFSNGSEDLPEQYKHNRFYSDGSIRIDIYVNDVKMDVKVFPDENAPDIAGYDNFGDYVLAQPIAEFLGITCAANAEENTLTLSSSSYEDTVYPYENYVKIIDDELYIDFALFRVHTFGSLKQENAKAMYLYTCDYQRSDLPATLEECYSALDNELTRKDKKYYKNISDEDMSLEYFMGLGLWIRNNWLYPNSKLTNLFNEYDIYHEDDISGMILEGYVRHLNKQPCSLEDLLEE